MGTTRLTAFPRMYSTPPVPQKEASTAAAPLGMVPSEELPLVAEVAFRAAPPLEETAILARCAVVTLLLFSMRGGSWMLSRRWRPPAALFVEDDDRSTGCAVGGDEEKP